MTRPSLDLRYGRRGGGWLDSPDRKPLTGPPCTVCERPMLCGQPGTHYTCTPRLPCCGWPAGMVGKLSAHRAQHLEGDQ